MTIWILALLLFAGVGALGRQIGGIRMGISLIGVAVALLAAGPLAPVVRSALGAVGIKNPILMWALAAPLAFLGIMMAFNSVAVGIYIKVSGFYKFRAPDDVRMRWERIDAGLGLTAGLLAAVLYLMAASSYLFHVGYFTAQVESPDDSPIWLKLVNKVHSDLASSSFDRVATGVGKASPEFFQMAEVTGLLYHNPDLQARLTEYPLFMSLAENPDLQGMFTNAAYAVLLPAKTNVSLILKDPTTQQIFAHGEIQRVAKEVELPDLLNFLQTGVSEKYAKEPLVGKWQIDLRETMLAFRRANPKVSAVDANRLAGLMRFAISDYTLTVTPDEKVFVKGKRDPLAFVAMVTPGFRFPILEPDAPVKNVATGSWKKEGDNYQFTLQTPAGERTAAAKLTATKIATQVGANPVVFARMN
ncbi:MAG: hypothetical protein B9S33_16440 [Pedosphaera sp. Tous-C6FEB]|nr:MAG: hypothetical protein B9S33_16440 [Pedosphaera sp. Tous-C6FEB]